tara:strand:- start:416 stop:1561 length:1146 start_codon:yes stop_codon:yes gene_type:complete
MAHRDPIQEAYEERFRTLEAGNDSVLAEQEAPVEDPKKAAKETPEQKPEPEDLTPDSKLPDGKELDTDPEDVPGVDLEKQNAPSEEDEEMKKVDDEEEEDEDEDKEEDDEDMPWKSKKESVDLDIDAIISESLKDKEDVSALVNDDTLTEETKTNLVEVFNAAIRAKVTVVSEKVVEEANSQLSTISEEMNREMTENVDQYLDYVVSEWLKENKLAVDKGIRTEVTESFMRGLRNLLNEHHVMVDEDRRDLIEELEGKVQSLEDQINGQMKKEMEIRAEVTESECKATFGEVSQGLLETEIEKLASLAEGLEFDTVDQYREKLELLKKSYFTRKPSNTKNSNPEPESVNEDVTDEPKITSEDPVMRSYLSSINRQVKSKQF